MKKLPAPISATTGAPTILTVRGKRVILDSELAALYGVPTKQLNQLRGDFRGLSERRLMECLTRLGRDVQIVVTAAPRSRGLGKLSVVVVM